MRVTSHVRGDLRAATLVLVSMLGPRSLAGPASCPSPCSATSPPTWLCLPPPSWPLKAPPGSWALCTPLPAWRARGRGYGFSEAPPGALSLVLTQGKGCVWQKQLYRHGGRGGAPPSHLESLLMTRIRAAFSSLSRWLSARRSDRACEVGRRVSRVALGRLYPLPTLALSPQLPTSSHLQFLLQFGCLSLQGPALLE